jgi:hypothetical protein
LDIPVGSPSLLRVVFARMVCTLCLRC